MTDIASNLARVRETIATTAITSGRNPDAIKLIAVSKTHPIESIDAALRVGQRAFGESTAQEALPKIEYFRRTDVSPNATPEWHFIGHLQSNKTRFVPGNFTWIHSLDSMKLAERVSRAAEEQFAVVNMLIEVNVTGDPRKHGVAPNALFALLDQLQHRTLAGIRLCGLMTIGPHTTTEADARRAFAALRGLRDDCIRRFALADFTELSMGMSGDYLAAVKEGATLVRVGTAIFGDRRYSTARSPAR